jgi:transcriptional regulator with XRE-family HTH domain
MSTTQGEPSPESGVSVDAKDPASQMGPNVRARRKRMGLSLDALAKRSGVSTTMLSEVERGVKNPTVKLAYQIARALGCSLTELLESSPVPAVHVVRSGQRRSLVDPQTGVTRHGMRTELLERQLEVVWYELPPGATAGEMDPNRPGVVELLSVVRGELTLRLGESEYALGPGDSITYGAQTVMEYRNDARQPCTVLLISDSSRA